MHSVALGHNTSCYLILICHSCDSLLAARKGVLLLFSLLSSRELYKLVPMEGKRTKGGLRRENGAGNCSSSLLNTWSASNFKATKNDLTFFALNQNCEKGSGIHRPPWPDLSAISLEKEKMEAVGTLAP